MTNSNNAGKGSSRDLMITAGIVVCFHTVAQLLEEAVFKYPGFKHGLFMTLFLFVVNVCWNIFYDLLRTFILPENIFSSNNNNKDNDKDDNLIAPVAFKPRRRLGDSMPSIKRYRRDGSLWWLVGVSFCFVGSNGLSKMALQYMNVPSQMIFKCLKLIPVMIGSTIILKKMYTGLEYAIALAMVSGASMFSLGDANSSPNFQKEGIIVISIALCFDAMLGNVQERILKRQIAKMEDIMVCQATFGMFYSLFLAWSSDQLFSGIALVFGDVKLFLLLIAWAGTNLIAIALVLQLVMKFSAVTAVTITLGRKLLSIALSFIVFPKPFTMLHFGGVVLVLGAAGAHSTQKQLALLIERCSMRAPPVPSSLFRKEIAKWKRTRAVVGTRGWLGRWLGGESSISSSGSGDSNGVMYDVEDGRIGGGGGAAATTTTTAAATATASTRKSILEEKMHL